MGIELLIGALAIGSSVASARQQKKQAKAAERRARSQAKLAAAENQASAESAQARNQAADALQQQERDQADQAADNTAEVDSGVRRRTPASLFRTGSASVGFRL
jgi:uncharacterized protein HemX